MDRLTDELVGLAKTDGIKLAENEVDDVLIYALFQQVGINFLKNRNNPDAFEPAPGNEPAPQVTSTAASTSDFAAESYKVSVNGTQYDVVVGPGNSDISQIAPAASSAGPAAATGGTAIKAPLAGSVIENLVTVGQQINEGDPVMVIEAMKMETEIRSSCSGSVLSITANKGDAIQAEQTLMTVG
jgi:oxaloacetate decarboxylase alpha subunit